MRPMRPMRTPRARWLAWSLVALAVALSLGALPLVVVTSLWLQAPERHAEPLAKPTGLLPPVVRSSAGILITQDPPKLPDEGVVQ
jgi:hypothetical protein